MTTATLDVRSDVINGLSRRRFLGGVSLVAVLAACGSESGTNPSTTDDAIEGSGFPVTVDHKYGSTTIPAEPQRVVTVGFTDPDFVLALGVKPVRSRTGTATIPSASGRGHRMPSVTRNLASCPAHKATSSTSKLIAGFRPDLIIGQYTGMTEEEYERASQLAPTVAQSGEHQDYTTPWQVTMQTVGKALGRSSQAEQLIAGVESRFASARREHPEFVGAPLIVAERFETGSTYIRTEKEPQNGLFRDLGFMQPAEIVELLVNEDGYSSNLSDERMELLDSASVVVWKLFLDHDDPQQGRVPDELAKHLLYPNLKVAREGRDLFLTDKVLVGALAFGSVLSLPYALDRIVPMLAAALDGDPATVPVS